MPSFQPDYAISKQTHSMSSSGTSIELEQGHRRFMTMLYCVITSAASLTAGTFQVQTQMPDDSATWTGALQDICWISGLGTPAGVNANTASAALIANGVARNTSGITALTANGIFVVYVPNTGRPLRCVTTASSGTATMTVTMAGLIAV
jgi:hypothetical protein